MRSSPAILIVQFSANIDGSAMSALMLADGLKKAGWETVIALGFDGPIKRKFENKGHRTYVVPHKNWLRRSKLKSFIKDVIIECRNADRFVQILTIQGLKLIYINTSVSLAAAIAAKKSGIPCVWHLRELFADFGGELQVPSLLRNFVPFVFRILAGRLVVNSKAVGQNLLGLGWTRHAEVVYNAVSDNFFDYEDDKNKARLSMRIPSSALLIGVPGTLRPVKGHKYFLKAVKPLISLYPKLHIAICGGGQSDYVSVIKRQAKNMEGSERIHFVGWVDDMTIFYRACDICCIPSKAEAFPRVVIEAFACGVPVIATNAGGLIEIIKDGKNGFLVPYGDEQGLREKLVGLLSSQTLRLEIGDAGKRNALSKYQEFMYQKKLVKLVNAYTTEGNHRSYISG